MRLVSIFFRPLGQLLYLLAGGLIVLLVVSFAVAILVVTPILLVGYFGTQLAFWLVVSMVVAVDPDRFSRLHRWPLILIVAFHVGIGYGLYLI
ncbi:MAG: hypothetical protein ACREEP_09940, partial [Dongiaceae bacterium]